MDAPSQPIIPTEPLAVAPTWRLDRGLRGPDGEALLLRRPSADSEQSRAELRHEIEIAARIPADVILRPRGIERVDDTVALIYENVAGELLSATLGTRRSGAEVQRIALSLAWALRSLHLSGICHRSLQPRSILLAVDGSVRLTNLTFAKPYSESDVETPTRLEGDLTYLAPEQTGRMPRAIGPRSDLYSVGVVLYELLAGAPPFVRGSPLELIYSHITEAPPPIADLDELGQSLERIIQRLLAKEPEERFADADRLIEALAQSESRPADPRAASLQLPDKLYGRQGPKTMLMAAFDRAAEGRCVLATLTGRAGVGKSSLAHEVARELAMERAICTVGKFESLGGDAPLSALTDAARILVRYVLTLDSREVSAWREHLLYGLGSTLPVLSIILPEIEDLFGEQGAPPPVPLADAQPRLLLALQRFISAFARAQRPLILLLEDLQWADAASQRLLQALLRDSVNLHLIIIVTARTTDTAHPEPLTQLVQAARASGSSPLEIELGPLTETDLRALLLDALHVDDTEDAEELIAELLLRTRGNPLFVREFLRVLGRERLLRYDPVVARWTWDLREIGGAKLPDSVAELLSGELDQLPPESRALLHDAASLGIGFSACDLATAHGATLSELRTLLSPALSRDLLLVEEGPAHLLDDRVMGQDAPPEVKLRFVHDRVRQAAYAQIPPEARAAVHARIGRRLLRDARRQGLALQGDLLLRIVGHLNEGAGLLSPEERRELVDLDYDAARTAKGSAAYEVALRLLEAAVELIGERWDDIPQAFKIHAALVDCEHLVGDNRRALALLGPLEARATSVTERLRAADLRVVLSVSAGDTDAALKAGRDGLAAAGITLPEEALECRRGVADELARIEAQLEQTPLAQRTRSPPVSDPVIRGVLTLLADMLAPANMTRPDLYALINTTQIRLSIEHGHTDVSAYTYSVYGYFLATAMGRYAQAEEFGEFALGLNEALGNTALRCRLRFVVATYAHFFRPLRQVLAEFDTALADGRESGDYIYLSSACSHVLIVRLSVGDPLDAVADQAAHFLELMQRTRVASSIAAITVAQQLIAALRGATLAPSSLADGTFDEAEFIRSCETSGRTFALRWYVTASLLLALLFADRPQMRRLLRRFGPSIRGNYAFYFATEFAALACLALCDLARDEEEDPSGRGELRGDAAIAEMRAYREALEGWAEACPANYAALAALVRAEVGSLRGADRRETGDAYDAAITSARADNLVLFEALACERAASHYGRCARPSFARALLREARDAYQRWGALRKVADLDGKLGLQADLPRPAGATSPQADLDLRSVIQASQALTSALSFDELLQVIMRITALTASATRALLILDDEVEGLRIAGASVSQGPRPRITEPRLDLTQEAPAAPIRLALRTLREIAIDDPEYANLRSQDPYLARVQPRSALCVPLVYGAQAHGVLYLENHVAAGVYNAGRREAIRLLATQIAISLEHTQLYSNLELARASAESANQAKSSFLANMSHELRTPLTAILGYAELIAEESTDRGDLTNIPDLERIHRSGVHLLEVIGDILDLSKIEADKFEVVVEEFEVAPLLQTVVEAVQPTVLAGENTLVFTPPAGLSTIRSDRLRLRQILLNLLSNAAKFTERGTVTLTAARADGRLRVSVRDTGIGMSPKQLRQVFDAFHQADASATRKVGGTGLGLTISRRLAQLLGGDITAVSAPGEGSRFTLDLPLDLPLDLAPSTATKNQRSSSS